MIRKYVHRFVAAYHLPQMNITGIQYAMVVSSSYRRRPSTTIIVETNKPSYIEDLNLAYNYMHPTQTRCTVSSNPSLQRRVGQSGRL
jgi:hypothetical protein